MAEVSENTPATSTSTSLPVNTILVDDSVDEKMGVTNESWNSDTNGNNQKEEGDDAKQQPHEEEQQKTVGTVVPKKKTWANLATQQQQQQQQADERTKKKKSLMEIMAEEQEISQANQQKKEDNQLMQLVIQASLAETTANNDTAIVNPSTEEDEIQLAIRLSMMEAEAKSASAAVPQVSSAVASHTAAAAAGLSAEEMASIEKAIRDAEAEEAAKSIQLAMKLQEEDNRKLPPPTATQQQQGNVRTLSRAEYNRFLLQGATQKQLPHVDDDHDDVYRGEAGYRINSNNMADSEWTKVDQNTILGPNNEIRTKHDLELQGQANAARLQLDEDGAPYVGNKAFNSFRRTMQKKTNKGVATHGQGRAHADSEKTKQGSLDSRVRIQISKAINNGLIEKLNGCVKEGKEALVYHADKPSCSDGSGTNNDNGKQQQKYQYDVAVKIFKRIQEFRNRGEYIDGDPRYDGKDYSHASGREQLEIWAEKEYRNLVRAYRAKVPVPQPLFQKENVLFLRFLGQDCWPSPQLRELNIKKGSKKWTSLYEQTMSAIQILYNDARLVHGDLSEYNILVCPSWLLLHQDDDEDEKMKVTAEEEEDGDKGIDIVVDDSSDDVKEANNPVADDDNIIKDATKPAGGSEVGEDKADDANEKARATDTTNQNDVNASEKGHKEGDDSLQIALIDFGQAVDLRHPDSDELLRRDLLRVKQFFDRIGITTISLEASIHYVQTKGAPLR